MSEGGSILSGMLSDPHFADLPPEVRAVFSKVAMGVDSGELNAEKTALFLVSMGIVQAVESSEHFKSTTGGTCKMLEGGQIGFEIEISGVVFEFVPRRRP